MIYENIEHVWEQCVKFKIQQKKWEFLNFIREFNNQYNKKINILEIGSWNCGSTTGFSFFAENLVTIDALAELYCDLSEIKNRCNFKFISGDSNKIETFNRVKDLNIEFDVLFIDGQHKYNYVKFDFEEYKKLMNKEMFFIGFHDIIKSRYNDENNVDVYRYWNEIKNNYNYKEIYTNQYDDIILPINFNQNGEDLNGIGLHWGGIGVIKK